jgi:tRNA 5-methylaminomethyl-2-thiouridine biosynthesis bifunctional protein
MTRPQPDTGLPDLIAGWAGRPLWRVLDTDFAGGGGFLALWQAWRQDPQHPDRLHVIAITGSPVLALAPPMPDIAPDGLAPLRAALRDQGWGLLPGFHRLLFDEGRVQLTLCVADLKTALREQAFEADAVRLALPPARPPADTRGDDPPFIHGLKALRPCCRRGTRFVTAAMAPSASADLQAALLTCGFEIGAPRIATDGDVSLHGSFNPRWQLHRPGPAAEAPGGGAPSRCIVIGGGLAGACVAFSLAQRGWQVEVLDRAAEPAAGASGLPAGLVAPHVSPDDRALSRLSRAGVRATLQRARELLRAGVDWAPSGVLEHRVEGKRNLPAAWAEAATQGVPHAGLEWSAPASAAQLRQAGLPAPTPALWHAQAGWIKPAELVRAMLAAPGIQWRGGQAVRGLVRDTTGWHVLDEQGRVLAQAPLVVVAAGFDTQALLAAQPPAGRALPLNPLRGQIAWGPMPDDPDATRVLPPFPVNGHGSLVAHVPTDQGPAWFTGSTFERANALPTLAPQDHLANLARLETLLPEAGRVLAPQFTEGRAQAWAGVRCTVPDRVPVVGPLDPQAQPGLWVSTAMGARGLTLAVLCGELAAAWLHGEPLPMERSLARLLAAQRWHAPTQPA